MHSKIKLAITGLIVAGICFSPVNLDAYFFTEEDGETETYYNEEFILVEEEPAMNQFYAMVQREGYIKYVKYNAYFNQVFPITNFFELGDSVPKLSTIDPLNRRFFFTTNDGLKSTLYVIGLDTGEIVRSYKYEYRIASMEYDIESEKIYGIAQNRHRNNKTFEVDTFTGRFTKLSDLSVIHNLEMETAFVHPTRREVWVLAQKRRADYLMTVHLESGRAQIGKIAMVQPEGWKFYNFNLQKVNQLIFTRANKDSIILVGFNEQYLTTFTVHMTIHSTNVKDLMAEVQAKLKEVSPNGLSDYELTIVSTRAVENFIAFSKAQVLENNLKSLYDVEEIKRTFYFIGDPYNVITSVNGIGIY